MIGACAASGEAGRISALMDAVDCRVEGYVEAAYQAIFGDVGWLGPTLTASLTVYVAICGFRLLTGTGGISLHGISRRILALGAVLAFATNWAAYQTVAVRFAFDGTQELASVLAGAGGVQASSSPTVVARLDAVFEAITDLASTWSHATPLDRSVQSNAAQPQFPAAVAQPPAPGGASAVNMLWFSAIALALGSAGVLVIAKILLGFLLAVGPIFILLALFPATRALFEGWLRAVAANALVPVFGLLASAGALGVVEPIVAAIALDQQRGVTDAEPVFVLAIAALIFAMLMAMAVATTTRLAGAWRLPFSVSQAPAPPPETQPSTPPAFGAGTRIHELVAAAGQGAAVETGAPDRRAVGAEILVAFSDADRRDPDEFVHRRPQRSYRGFGAMRLARGRS